MQLILIEFSCLIIIKEEKVALLAQVGSYKLKL